MPTIELSTEINADIEICFDLSRSIDLHIISTAKTNEKAIEGKTTGLIGLDEFVTWEAVHFGIKQNLTSKITAFKRPVYFRDEQLNGPFKFFKHDHYFEKHNDKVIVKDVFNFQSPFGLAGRIFDKLVLKNYLKKLLIKRNEVIKNYAETDKWKSLPGDGEKLHL
ncbi:MAG: SRPBCC family protein [Bacteroidota bacterium]